MENGKRTKLIVALIVVAVVVIAAIVIVRPVIQEGRMMGQYIETVGTPASSTTLKRSTIRKNLFQKSVEIFRGGLAARLPVCNNNELCVVATKSEDTPEAKTYTSFDSTRKIWVDLAKFNFKIKWPTEGLVDADKTSGNQKITNITVNVGNALDGKRLRLIRIGSNQESEEKTVEGAEATWANLTNNMYIVCTWESTGTATIGCNPRDGVNFIVQVKLGNDFIKDLPIDAIKTVTAAIADFETADSAADENGDAKAAQGTPSPDGNTMTFRHPQYTLSLATDTPAAQEITTPGWYQVAKFIATTSDRDLKVLRVATWVDSEGSTSFYQHFNTPGVAIRMRLLGWDIKDLTNTNSLIFESAGEEPLVIPKDGTLELPIEMEITNPMLSTLTAGTGLPFRIKLTAQPEGTLRVRSDIPSGTPVNDRVQGWALFTGNTDLIGNTMTLAVPEPVVPEEPVEPGAVCGNGIIEDGEFCDFGEENGPGNLCTDSCTVDRTAITVCEAECQALLALDDFGLAINGTFLGLAPNTPAVYVFQNGELHGIPNPQTLGACVYNMIPTPEIHPVGATTFNNLPIGSDVFLGPIAETEHTSPSPSNYDNYVRNGMFVRDNSPDSSDPTTYYMEGCVRRGIPTPEVFNSLGGPTAGVAEIDSAMQNILRGDDY